MNMKTHPLRLSVLGAASVAVTLMGGCATRQPRVVNPPDLPVMPPTSASANTRPPIVSVPVQSFPVATPKPIDVRPVAPLGGTPYTVKKGDSLSLIASKHGVRAQDLANHNRIANTNSLRVGQVLLIPGNGKKPAGGITQSSGPRPAAPAPVAATGGTYVVKSGDSLSKIAQQNRTSVRALKDANGLSSDVVKVGQTLKLPGASATTSTLAAAPRATPSAITPNGAPTPAATRPIAAVPTPTPRPLDTNLENFSTTPAPAPTVARTSAALDKAFPIVVEEGETLDDIARSYIVPKEEIRKLNNLPADAVLKAGQTLLIPPSVY
jgi:peptidoglycan endopeptidase LytF